MGEILRTRGLKIVIEDTTVDNKREAEHIHIYHNGNRYSAFINRKEQFFYFKHPIGKNEKFIKRILNNNYDFIVAQYDNKKEDKPLLRIKLD